MAPGDSWLSDYKGVEQYGQDIMEKINQRNQLRNTGGNYSRVQTEVRIMLKNFTRDLNNLKQGLLRASSSYHITEKEVERRQNLLDNLITREKQLNSAFQQDSESYDIGRNTLLSGDVRARDPYGPGFDGPNINDMDIGTMRQQQQQMIEEQDKGLDVLSSIIQRQKMMGQAISDEVDVQNEIIEDITDHVDNTNQRLIKETAHVQRITAKSSTCGMLVVIVLLFIVIIVVAVVPKP